MATPPTYAPADPPMEHADLRETLLADEHPVDIEALLARTRSAVAADTGARARARRLSTPARVALVLSMAALTAALSALVTPRSDLALVHPIPFVVACGVALGGALAGVVWAMRPTWATERVTVGWTVLVAALVAPVVIPAIPIISAAHEVKVPIGDLPSITVACFLFGTGVAVAVAAVWRIVERRSWVSPLRWATAFAAAGAVGNLALLLHCPVAHQGHQLFGHASVGAVWAGLAALGALAQRSMRS